MTTTRAALAILMACSCLAPSLAVAASYDYEIDPVHSSIVFKVMRGDLNYVHGRFNDFGGKVTVDSRTEPKSLKIEASVDSKSVDTNNKGRDRHLRQDDFLNAKEHKDISFTTTESKKLADNKFELKGEMNFLGKKMPLTVTFDVHGMDKGKGAYVLGGDTTFNVKCSEFGMPAHPGIADEVTITVSIHAVQKMPPAG